MLFEVSALAAIIGAARRYSADSSALLAAVQKLAGPGSGIGVVDAAQLAVNTVSVLQTLEAVFESLREGSGKLPASTLRNLSAYLTLQRAAEATGFKPEVSRLYLEGQQLSIGCMCFFEFSWRHVLARHAC